MLNNHNKKKYNNIYDYVIKLFKGAKHSLAPI